MALSRSEIGNIARLARLELREEELATYETDLSRIIDLVNQLQSAETAGVAPMAHPLHMAQRLREDAVTELNRRELYQRNAPAVEAGLFLVPKVIE